MSSSRNFWHSKANRKQNQKPDHVQLTEPAAIETPLESPEAAYEKILGELKTELLDRLKAEAPALFERIVIELLVKMGYGGSRADAAQAIGKSGDEGLDGIIKEDRLGLDVIWTILSASERRKLDSNRTAPKHRPPPGSRILAFGLESLELQV